MALTGLVLMLGPRETLFSVAEKTSERAFCQISFND